MQIWGERREEGRRRDVEITEKEIDRRWIWNESRERWPQKERREKLRGK